MLDAAKELFAELGYEGASVRAIAGAAGACQMVCVSRTERNGKNHDHDRREEPRRALGPGPGRAAESLRGGVSDGLCKPYREER
ncbi:helix-turn-helix domain-containing protein [Micrococcus sp. 116]|uniref:helix-turn-helix domain-containing protein n=1 Tax=Micrococcus sp. 116 TaxID=2653154 RepID=UPI00272E46BB|nr:helix-turn-helix domain-containing protein [Micrococcus sp. 116]